MDSTNVKTHVEALGPRFDSGRLHHIWGHYYLDAEKKYKKEKGVKLKGI